jgi:FkbM family methyltransferase
MLISLPEIVSKYDLKIKGVIQVGAHWAEEHTIYRELGVNKNTEVSQIIYIEPCSNNFNIMVSKISDTDLSVCKVWDELDVRIVKCGDVKMFNCACGATEGEFDMFVSHNNQGQSNSLLRPKLHLQQHPEVIFTDHEKVKVRRLDNLPFYKENFNLLVMDCQGFEGEILLGASETLKHIDFIYTECNNGQTYAGNMEIEQMDLLLGNEGFERTDTYWPSPLWSWGDCCYIRRSLLK